MPLIENIIDGVELYGQNNRTIGSFTLKKDNMRVPLYYVSSGAVVFIIECRNGEMKALKCYQKAKPNIGVRYELLNRLAESIDDFCIPRFEFYSNELKVYQRDNFMELDILVYDWVEGETLKQRIKSLCMRGDSKGLFLLSKQIARLFVSMLDKDIAHGDVKPENIIIGKDGHFTLIDWDGFYHYSVKDYEPVDIGTIWYNHPSRDTADYGDTMDCYAISVVIVSIFALSCNVDLYEDSDRLLFDTIDVVNNSSELFNEMRGAMVYHSNIVAFMECMTQRYHSKELMCKMLNAYVGNVRCSIDRYEVLDDDEMGYKRVIEKSTGLYGLIDAYGTIIIDAIYGDMTCCNDGYMAVRMGNRYLVIDLDGYHYDIGDCSHVREICNGIIAVKLDGKWGFWSVKNQEAICECVYSQVSDFSDIGVAMVEVDGRYNFIDKCGAVLFDEDFKYASPINRDGCAKVSKDGQNFYVIDRTAFEQR